MIAVLDVSGAAQIILQKEKFKKYKEIIDNAKMVIAPDLYVSELSNTFWKYYKAKIFTAEECNLYIEDGINLIDEFIDAKQLWRECFGESIKNDHSVYDIYYVVITRRNNGVLITNDSDLARICKKNGIEYIY